MHHNQEGDVGHGLCYFTIRTDHSALKLGLELQRALRPGSQMAKDVVHLLTNHAILGYNCSGCGFLTFFGFCFNETCPCLDFYWG